MSKSHGSDKKQRPGAVPKTPDAQEAAPVHDDAALAAKKGLFEAGSAHRVTLSRRDVIFFEQRLKEIIHSLLPFKGHSIHFPRTTEARQADWSREEDKLLLPLPAPVAPSCSQMETSESSGHSSRPSQSGQAAPAVKEGMAKATAAPQGLTGMSASPARALPAGFTRNGASPQTVGSTPMQSSGKTPLEPAKGPSMQSGAQNTLHQGPALGVFVARGVPEERAAALLPYWPSLGCLVTDNLLQYKRSICDPVTGLFSRHYLLDCLAREIETLRYTLPVPAGSSEAHGSARTQGTAQGMGQDFSLHSGVQAVFHPSGEGLFARGAEMARRASVGVLVVRFAALRDVVREFGYQFADDLMVALADALAPLCPEQALASRTGDFEFALHLPAATAKECTTLATDIAAAMRAVYLVHPLRRERVGIGASVGFMLYPQDMAGENFLRPAMEQARLALRKARLAAALADEDRPLLSSRQGAEPIMAFSRILSEGGRVLEVLPLSRVMVSLGANMHAREGQRFSVWSVHYPVRGMDSQTGKFTDTAHMVPLYKGELVLMDVLENASQAEVITLGDPSWSIEPGDRLVLLPEEQSSSARPLEGEDRHDPDTGLLRHGDFFARWAGERETCDAFTLALIRIGGPRHMDRDTSLSSPDGAEASSHTDFATDFAGSAIAASTASTESRPSSHFLDEDGAQEGDALYPGQIMARAAGLCRDELGQKTLGGRFGLNSLIFFHPEMDEAKAQERYEALAALLEETLGMEVAVGLACHPCLNFRKADAPENCRKALEYAMLLPRPHVGVLDSLALNISADKLFSRGDSFSAIKEYQLALLADETNGMAWNSLGICLAGLGRHAEAERNFTQALSCNADDVMALYNLGYMHQSQSRDAEAEGQYHQCLDLAPEHLFALMRLGQLAENRDDKVTARAFYEKAAALPGGESLTCRLFARLCLNEGDSDQAREHLHEALLHDPQDAVSLQLLARLYLDAGEDPDMAASLARQSVSLRPSFKSGWLELARALDAMGKDQQAKEARLRAAEV